MGLDLGRMGEGRDGWRCKVERSFQLNSDKVWFVRNTGSYAEVLRADGSVERLEHYVQLPEEPTLTLPSGAIEAFAAAAGDVLPPSAATDRHLADTIEVRNRLLALVEKVT